MKKIKLAYSKLYNAGDLMNVDIVEKIGECKVIHSRTFSADMTAIGGALFGLQYSDKWYKKVYQLILHFIYNKKPVAIWGSGFWHDYNANKLFRNNLKVYALRGKKSQEKLNRLTGKKYDVPLADAGLLVDSLITPAKKKLYKIGLIPHMSQQEEVTLKRMASMEGVHLINIKDTPQNVALEISKCETVASSSLHGLIFADSLHVPNIHILGKKQLKEGNFKFEDYYSSYGLNDAPVILEDHIPTYEEIIENYRVDFELVEKKKKELIDNFPIFS